MWRLSQLTTSAARCRASGATSHARRVSRWMSIETAAAASRSDSIESIAAAAAAAAAVPPRPMQPSPTTYPRRKSFRSPVIAPPLPVTPFDPLPPPSAPLIRPAPAHYRPPRLRKPLPERTQQLLEEKFIPMRRKLHPKWMEKPHVRKMTPWERKQLLTEIHEQYDLANLERHLQRADNPHASLQYAQRCHLWFLAVVKHANLDTYHSLLRLATRFELWNRLDEYWHLLLRHHRPNPQSFELMLYAHSKAGHVSRVESLIRHMVGLENPVEKAREEVRREVEAAKEKQQQQQQQLQLQKGEGGEKAEATSDSVASTTSSSLAPRTSSSVTVFDPTDNLHKLSQRLQDLSQVSYQFTEAHFIHLLRAHMVNNDTDAVLDLVGKLKSGQEFYPHAPAVSRPLKLTMDLSELLMHYYSLHRLLPQAIELISWLENARLPITMMGAWHFFDAFKREVVWRKCHEAAASGFKTSSGATQATKATSNQSKSKKGQISSSTTDPSILMQMEMERRNKKVPEHVPDPTMPNLIPQLEKNRMKQQGLLLSAGTTTNMNDHQQLYAQNPQPISNSYSVASPFSNAVQGLPGSDQTALTATPLSSFSVDQPSFRHDLPRLPQLSKPLSIEEASKYGLSFPKSPVREKVRKIQPSPLDALKEQIDMDGIIGRPSAHTTTPNIINLPHPFQSTFQTGATFTDVLDLMSQEHGFLPTPRLFNAYLTFFLQQQYPTLGRFVEVMIHQTRKIEQVFDEKRTEECWYQHLMRHQRSVRSDEDTPDSLRSRSFQPFRADSETYSLLIEALMVRRLPKSFSPQSLSLHASTSAPTATDRLLLSQLRSEMRSRHLEPTLKTKINMMTLMAYDEKWEELYASFQLLWQGEKLRREKKLAKLVREAKTETDQTPTPKMETMLADEANQREKESKLRRKGKASENSPSFFLRSALHNEPFTAMSLLPVFHALATRPTLDRFNLFMGIIGQTRHSELGTTSRYGENRSGSFLVGSEEPFFNAILQVLVDRGCVFECLDLIKLMRERYQVDLRAKGDSKQFDALLASIVHRGEIQLYELEKRQATQESIESIKKSLLITLFQTWQSMSLLNLPLSTQTYMILLQGCFRFGQYEDAARVWEELNHKSPQRPTLGHYTLYLDILLHHHRVSEALSVLRSQSFKDGYDWTLRECHALLDYVQSKEFIQLANKTQMSNQADDHHHAESQSVEQKLDSNEKPISPPSSTTPSSSSPPTSSADFAPTPQQVQLYGRIRNLARGLSIKLLEYEKVGGQVSGVAAAGMLSVAEVGEIPHVMQVRRRMIHVANGMHRMLTLAEREEDEVATITTIPGALFAREMLPLIRSIEAFIGDSGRKRMETVSGSMMIESGGAGEQAENTTDQQRSSSINVEELADRLINQAAERLRENEVNNLPQSSTTEQISTTMSTPSTPGPSPPPHSSSSSFSSDPFASITPPSSEALQAEAAENEVVHARAQRRQQEREMKAKKRFAKMMMEAEENDSSKKKQKQQTQSSASGAVAPAADSNIDTTSPLARSVLSVMDDLRSKASKVYPLRATIQPPVHPVLLDGKDLCTLRREARLKELTIPMLHQVQLSMMGQPKAMIKGIKSHHLAIVEAWLGNCSCCMRNQQNDTK